MASHAQRLQMSKCFLSSSHETQKLTCITCHNPHVSVKVTGKQVFNNACQSCHNMQDSLMILCSDEKVKKMSIVLTSDGNPTTPRIKSSANCVSCHMPRSGTVDIPHVTVHDHKIQIPAKQ